MLHETCLTVNASRPPRGDNDDVIFESMPEAGPGSVQPCRLSSKLFLALALTVLMAASAVGLAQSGLSDDAAEALRAGQAAASEAIATYERHYPDQPLWQEAIEQGERARQLAPGRTEPLRFLAQVYGATGWTARTWQTWQEYLGVGGSLDARSRADAARSALVLGYQAFSAGALDRALDLLRASYELEPDDITTVTYLGQTELELGNPEAALPLLERAITTYPQLQPRLTRARLGADHGLPAADAFIAAEQRFAEGNAAGALSLYTAANQNSPGFIDALKGMAASYGALGRSAESRSTWERVAELAPEDTEAAAVIARFEAADDAAAEAEAAAEAAAEAQEAAELEAAEAAAAQEAAEVNSPPINIDPPVAQAPIEGQLSEDAEAEQEQPPVEDAVVEEPDDDVVVEEPEADEPDVAVVEPPEEPEQPAVPDDEQAGVVDEDDGPEDQDAQATGGPTIELLDTTLTTRAPDAGGEGAFNFLDAPAAIVGNLDAPFDYGQGTLHLQVEVLDKPTGDPILMQICLVPDDLITVSPACSEASRVRLSDEGVVTASQNVGALEGAAAIDWSQGMSQLLVVLRDTEGRPLDSRYAFDENGAPLDVGAFYPMDLHVKAALVPAGSTFSGW